MNQQIKVDVVGEARAESNSDKDNKFQEICVRYNGYLDCLERDKQEDYLALKESSGLDTDSHVAALLKIYNVAPESSFI